MADGSYTHKCRIGNWSEDFELEQLRMKEYLNKKQAGELLITKYQAKVNHSLQPVQLSTDTEGIVRFGNCVLLYSCKTKGVLSNDIGDLIISGGEKAYSVTTSTVSKNAAARNAYIIEPVGQHDQNGDAVLFGKPFRLRAHPKLSQQTALYLHSQPVSPLSASKYSRHQEVLLHPAVNTFDSVWKVCFKDKDLRLEMEGNRVPNRAEVVIMHCQTRQCLSSDFIKYENDFGVEFEVCAKTFADVAKNQTMKQEFQGEIIPETAQRNEHTNNHWAFILQNP